MTLVLLKLRQMTFVDDFNDREWMIQWKWLDFNFEWGWGPRVHIQIHSPPWYTSVLYFTMSKQTVMIVVEALNNLFSFHFDSDFMEYSIEFPPFSPFCSANWIKLVIIPLLVYINETCTWLGQETNAAGPENIARGWDLSPPERAFIRWQ